MKFISYVFLLKFPLRVWRLLPLNEHSVKGLNKTIIKTIYYFMYRAKRKS